MAEAALARSCSPPLGMWVIYDHPKDFPDRYVARQFYVGSGVILTTDNFMTSTDLGVLQRALARDGLTPVARGEGEDPAVLESWL